MSLLIDHIASVKNSSHTKRMRHTWEYVNCSTLQSINKADDGSLHPSLSYQVYIFPVNKFFGGSSIEDNILMRSALELKCFMTHKRRWDRAHPKDLSRRSFVP